MDRYWRLRSLFSPTPRRPILTTHTLAWTGDPSKGLEAWRLVWEGEQKSEFWLSYFLSLGLRSLRFAWVSEVSYSSEFFFFFFAPSMLLQGVFLKVYFWFELLSL